jgi:O-antigen/teichoic acid export membrane protein
MGLLANRLRTNVVLNTLSPLTNAVCGFIVLPFLISRLGRETYGFWTLIVATVGYFLVLDLGISTAVGRLIAAHRAKDDIRAINAVTVTALAFLFAVSLIVIAFSVAVPSAFFFLFSVPPAQQPDVAKALIIMTLAAALYFPALVPYGILWGYERFDLLNAVEIPTVLGRTALTLLIIKEGSTLSQLAFILAGSSIVGYLARVMICALLDRRLSIRPSLFSRAVAADMFSFGAWFSMLGFFRQVMPNVASFVIGHSLGSAAVTTFTIPRLLVSYTNWVMVSATQVVAPKATVYHFGRDDARQRELFVEGSSYDWALTLFFLGGAVLLGYPLLSLWQSQPQAEEYHLLLILMLGETFPLSQWVTYYAIVGKGQHRRLAVYACLEAACILIIGLLVARAAGLVGVALCVAAAAFVFRGLLQIQYGCQLIGLPVLDYLRAVFLRTTLIGATPIAALAIIQAWLPPATWVQFLLEGTFYALIYWAFMARRFPAAFAWVGKEPAPTDGTSSY